MHIRKRRQVGDEEEVVEELNRARFVSSLERRLILVRVVVIVE